MRRRAGGTAADFHFRDICSPLESARSRGISSRSMPKPVGESGGGLANAIVGTLILIAIASAFGLPVGVGAGLYLAEQKGSRLANSVRFLCRCAERSAVDRDGHFRLAVSRAAGRPLLGARGRRCARRDDDPDGRAHDGGDGRESFPCLCARPRSRSAIRAGAPRSRWCCAPRARGIVTGALVAIARIAGETAPLLFTAFGNQFWSTSLTQPIAALPLQVFSTRSAPMTMALPRLGRSARPHRAHPHHQPHRAFRNARPLRDRWR